jgi:hypothetical protein
MKKRIQRILLIAGAMVLAGVPALRADHDALTSSTAHRSATMAMAPKVPQKGYVGQVDFEVLAPGVFAASGANIGFTTTHGAMVDDRHFVGLGAGYLHDFDCDHGIIPIYAEGRIYFPSEVLSRIYPHVGLRLGGMYATEGGGGLYATLAVGIRVPLSTHRTALHVELGPQFTSKYNHAGTTIVGKYSSDGTHFGFFGRVGVEF